MDLPSLTPLAEYVDMLYMRCLHELAPIADLTWRIELRPPARREEGAGTVRLVGRSGDKVFEWHSNMHAIQRGARAGLDELNTVVDYHIHKFMEAIPR